MAGESKFLFSRQAYGYAKVLVAAAMAYRRSGLRSRRAEPA